MRMNALIFIIIIVTIYCGDCFSQKFIALDVSKVAGFKRIKYSVGDDIRFKLTNDKKKYTERIATFNDSLIYFESKKVVRIDDISVIYRDNANFVTRGLSKFCFRFGPAFLGLDVFNNLINQRKPLVNELAIKEGAAFVGAGLIFKHMLKKRYKIGKRRSLKVYDLNI